MTMESPTVTETPETSNTESLTETSNTENLTKTSNTESPTEITNTGSLTETANTESNTESLTKTSNTECPTETSDSESPVKTSNTESPAKTSNTESPAKTSNTESPAKTSNTECVAKTSNTESPAKSSNTECAANINNTESPAKTSNTGSPTISTRKSPRSKPSPTNKEAANGAVSSSSVRKNLSKAREVSSVNVNIKLENNEEEAPAQFERHFIKVEAAAECSDYEENVEADDAQETVSEEVNQEGESFQQSIFIRRDSELKTRETSKRSRGKNTAAGKASETGASTRNDVLEDWDEESITSVHSDDCEVLHEDIPVKKAKKAAPKSVPKKGNASKGKLKRKKEPAKAVTKKLKTSAVAGSSGIKASGGSAPAGLAGLRNIIGSNFKKLNLTINEPYDMKNEIGLSYKLEDPSMDTAASSQNADGSFECPKCGANFKWKTTLKFHMFNHLEDKALECNVCFKLFLSPAYLHEHKKVHLFENQDRNFNCQDCSGQFESEASLATHRVSHAKLDTQHYVCNVCKEKFASLFSLNSHKAKHSSAIKYECKPCDLRFKTLKTLTKHIATHNVEVKITENQ